MRVTPSALRTGRRICDHVGGPFRARVMLPARNRPDYEEIPTEARDKLEFVWLERVEDAVAAALDAASG